MKNVKILLFTIVNIFFVSCETYNEILAPINQVILNFKANQLEVPADGESYAEFMVELPINADTSRRTIKFKSDFGKFMPENKDEITRNAQITDVNGVNKLIALAKIKTDNSTTGVANVTCEIAGYIKSPIQVNFVNAYPERIKLTSDKIHLTSLFTDEIKFSTVVSRNKGIPTKNNIVDLYAVDSLNRKIGFLRNYDNLSDVSGKNFFTLTLGTLNTYNGKIVIKAITNNGKINIEDSLTIFSLKN